MGYCETHQRDRSLRYDAQRGTSTERGYDARWRAYREQFLRQHPVCADCERQGAITAATVVDHIKAHKGDQLLFWNEANHQALCASCHSRKTVTQDMGAWAGQS